MPVESTADRLSFLRDFGSALSVSGSPTVTITGIFDEQYLEVDANGGMQLSTNSSSFLIRSSDAATIPQQTIVIHDGVYYQIFDIQKQQDGVFSTVLFKRT